MADDDVALPRSRDVGRALINWFGHGPVQFPYIPAFALDDLRVRESQTLSTRAIDDMDLYQFDPAADALLTGPADTIYALSYSGHGINSWAWSLLLQRPGLRMLLQVLYGGVYNDPAGEIEELNEMFTIAREVDAMVVPGRDPEVVVLRSSFRGASCTGVVPASGSSLSLRELQLWDTGHPILVVDEIREYDAAQRETRQERVARQARIMDEWAQRWPAVAEGSEDDPQADLELALRMEEPVLGFAAHRWLPAKVGETQCAWCAQVEGDPRHQPAVPSVEPTVDPAAVDLRLAALVDFGCQQSLVDLLRDLPLDVAWTSRKSGGQSQFHIISASDGSEGAVYIDARHLMIALDPEDARGLMTVIDSRAEQRSATTWRVPITPEDVDDSAKRLSVIAALVRSLRRSAQRPRRN